MKSKYKKILLNGLVCFMLILMVVILFGTTWKSKYNNYKIITNIEEFYKLYLNDNPGIIFIDLRDETDYENGHIDSFINIPFKDDENNRLTEFLSKNGYKGKTLVLMCYSSLRASRAFNILVEGGYHNVTIINIESEKLLGEYKEDIVTGPCDCLE